jgi:molecular chaperone DnaJ
MAAAPSYYDVLGVAKTASADDIKKAFRRLSRKHHPDTGGTEEKFKELNEAYQVLSDPEKRSQYDQFGQYFGGNRPPGPGGPGAGGAGGPGWPGGGSGGPGGFTYTNVDLGDIGGLGDLFGSVFSGMGGGQAARSGHRGRDLTYEVTLSFEEALRGVSTKVDVQRTEACPACKGSGAAAGTSPTTCPTCGGTGRSSQGQGMFAVSRACARCAGAGTVIEHPCTTCRGKGRVVKVKPLTIQVPGGVTDGGTIRFKGKGEPGAGGGPAGDLYVVTHIRPHRYFKREGADILLDVPVTYEEAALGAEIEVPTPDDRVKIKLKAGTQSGKVFKVPGKGAPRLKGTTRGDMRVRVQVETPTGLSEEQKELLKRFGSSRSDDVRSHLKRS